MVHRARGEGLFAALRRLLSVLLDIGKTRLELLGTELQEEKTRLLGALASGVAALFLLGLGIILALACAAAAFWEYRVAIFGISALMVLAGGLYLVWQAVRLVTRPSNLFRASLSELDADLARLRKSSREPQ